MKRKYDLRNKRNFIIVLIIGLLIIGIFSLFVYRYLHTSKVSYDISAGSVLQDTNRNYINIEDLATLTKRWNGAYSLNYQDNKINLSKRVIVFDAITNKLHLYGNFYQIEENGKIKELNDETIIDNTNNGTFYKLADREYLLVDKQIISDDGSISANNYLLVELDRLGNAKISNNNLNLKTISPTKLVTSKYTFDIANEILKFDKLDIDLKKIIGTTNQYKEEEKKETDDNKENGGNINNNGTNNNANTWINNNNNNNQNIGGGFINNNEDKGTVTTIDEIKNKIKSTSIIRCGQGFTQIDIDYVVYDPYDQYESLYILLDNNLRKINLPKNDTHITIDNLIPDHLYTLSFVYTMVDKETNELIPNTFEELSIKTDKPTYSGKVIEYSAFNNQLTYRIDLQKNYNIDTIEGTLDVYHNVVTDDGNITEVKKTISFTINNINNQNNYITRTINLTEEDINDIVKLELAKVTINNVKSGNVVIKY